MSMYRLWQWMGICALLVAIDSSPVGAQLPTYGMGRPPTTEEVKAWDLTIPPDGQGLPPGSGTAALGKPIYAERCASCHGETGEDPKYSRLVGGYDTLAMDKPIRSIGSFWQYATTLWSYIRRSQPFDEPGSLTADQVYAVTAYLLHLNGIIGEQEVMDAKTLPLVKMPNRDGFVPDPRPDVGQASQ
ncbi:MAG TPA: cytochrome c [Candidatus Tectomicrobia bacterium]|nr:cytochrome c [Candidatus Tectomicrobia bacterium]